MKLRFGGADRNTHHPCNLFVLVSLDVVKYEYVPITVWQFGDRVLEGDPIDDRHLVRVGGSVYGLLRHFSIVGDLFVLNASPPEVHQHLVYGQTMKPGGKCRIAAETSGLSEKLDEDFLGQILGLRCVVCHPHRQTECTTVITLVDDLKGGQVSACSELTQSQVGCIRIKHRRGL